MKAICSDTERVHTRFWQLMKPNAKPIQDGSILFGRVTPDSDDRLTMRWLRPA